LRTLIVGDHFVGADDFLEAIHKTLGKDFGPVRTVTWAGASMEEQHAEQQVMEWKGPEAVRTPIEVVQAAGDAEIIAVHFAPIPIAVLDAAKDLKAVVVARTGVENVNLEQATRRGVAVVNVGLLHLQLALLSGAGSVIVSQRSPARRALAERLGAAVAVDPTSQDLAEVADEVTGGLGVDLAIIAIGVPELVNQAVRLTRVAGRVSIFAGLAGKGWAEVEANLIHYKQLVVTGSSDVRRSDYEAALDLITSERVDTASLVTHRFPLTDVAGAFEAAAGRQAMKVAVLPELTPDQERQSA
jgi:threonine dehydrogenase-like Zn-dependent dehydrogenase